MEKEDNMIDPNNIEFLQKAADLGNTIALYSLGFCYQHGFGFQKDLSKAIENYSKAAESGFPMANYNLGIL